MIVRLINSTATALTNSGADIVAGTFDSRHNKDLNGLTITKVRCAFRVSTIGTGTGNLTCKLVTRWETTSGTFESQKTADVDLVTFTRDLTTSLATGIYCFGSSTPFYGGQGISVVFNNPGTGVGTFAIDNLWLDILYERCAF